MHPGEQRVRPAVKKFQAEVRANVSEHEVIAHPKCVLAAVAAGIPRIDGSRGAGIGSDERGERKYAVAIVALARGKGGDHGMAQPWEKAPALAAVVQRVLPEGLGQSIA